MGGRWLTKVILVAFKRKEEELTHVSLKVPVCDHERAVIGSATLIEFRKGKLGQKENAANIFWYLCTGSISSG